MNLENITAEWVAIFALLVASGALLWGQILLKRAIVIQIDLLRDLNTRLQELEG